MSSGGVAPPRYEFYIQLKKLLLMSPIHQKIYFYFYWWEGDKILKIINIDYSTLDMMFYI